MSTIATHVGADERAGLAPLIRLVDDACGLDSATAITDRIKTALCQMIRVAMTWGPCQSTPIHDHAGMWCVEGVCAGLIDVLQYELMAQDDEQRYRFEPRNSYMAGVGSAGCLIPPYEYHQIANPCDRTPAVSLHIYGGDMTRCQVFVREGETNWYQRVTRELSFDA